MTKPSVPIALWDNVQKKYILHDSAEFEGSPLHDLYAASGAFNVPEKVEEVYEGSTTDRPYSYFFGRHCVLHTQLRVKLMVSITGQTKKKATQWANILFGIALSGFTREGEMESGMIKDDDYGFIVTAHKTIEDTEDDAEWYLAYTELATRATETAEQFEGVFYSIDLLRDEPNEEEAFEKWDEAIRDEVRHYEQMSPVRLPGIIRVSDQVAEEWAHRLDGFSSLWGRAVYNAGGTTFPFIVVGNPDQKEPFVIEPIR